MTGPNPRTPISLGHLRGPHTTGSPSAHRDYDNRGRPSRVEELGPEVEEVVSATHCLLVEVARDPAEVVEVAEEYDEWELRDVPGCVCRLGPRATGAGRG